MQHHDEHLSVSVCIISLIVFTEIGETFSSGLCCKALASVPSPVISHGKLVAYFYVTSKEQLSVNPITSELHYDSLRNSLRSLLVQ